MRPLHDVAAEAAHVARRARVGHMRGQRVRGGRAQGDILAAAQGAPEDALEGTNSVIRGLFVACHAHTQL